MLEYLLLLLLPVAIYFGWWLARTVERRSANAASALLAAVQDQHRVEPYPTKPGERRR